MATNFISNVLPTLSVRSSPSYQQAEARRQQKTAATMAGSPKTSDDYGAICFLIVTWETIATLALSLSKAERERVFEVTPILFMFLELKPAIDILRKDAQGPDYATSFEKLADLQDTWLKTKPQQYQSGEKGGMHAMFG